MTHHICLWITNTARRGVATNCPVTDEIAQLCQRAALVVGVGLLALDLDKTENGNGIAIIINPSID